MSTFKDKVDKGDWTKATREVGGGGKRMDYHRIQEKYLKKEELSIVSIILKRPTDKVSVKFGDMEAIDDPYGSLSM